MAIIFVVYHLNIKLDPSKFPHQYTFVDSVPIKMSIGKAMEITRASFQLVTKAITKHAMNVVKNCRKTATLSPIPE